MIGILVGRAATVSATKRYALRKNYKAQNDRHQRQRFIDDAVTTARVLKKGLGRRLELVDNDDSDPAAGGHILDFLLRSLIDSGGPHWSKNFDSFYEMSTISQKSAIKDIESMTLSVATALMARAGSDGWEFVWAEAADAAGWFMDDMVAGEVRSDTLIRPDLLIKRGGRKPRLIVDLKYRSNLTARSVADALDDVAERYAEPYCHTFGRPVSFSVLAYNEFDCLWSDEDRYDPRRLG